MNVIHDGLLRPKHMAVLKYRHGCVEQILRDKYWAFYNHNGMKSTKFRMYFPLYELLHISRPPVNPCSLTSSDLNFLVSKSVELWPVKIRPDDPEVSLVKFSSHAKIFNMNKMFPSSAFGRNFWLLWQISVTFPVSAAKCQNVILHQTLRASSHIIPGSPLVIIVKRLFKLRTLHSQRIVVTRPHSNRHWQETGKLPKKYMPVKECTTMHAKPFHQYPTEHWYDSHLCINELFIKFNFWDYHSGNYEEIAVVWDIRVYRRWRQQVPAKRTLLPTFNELQIS